MRKTLLMIFIYFFIGLSSFPLGAEVTDKEETTDSVLTTENLEQEKSDASDEISVQSEALEISDLLRCLVCLEENIELSQDEIAQDMRFFIRKHLEQGKTKDVVLHLLFSQYGSMISLQNEQSLTAKNEKIFVIFVSFVCFLLMFVYLFKRARSFKA